MIMQDLNSKGSLRDNFFNGTVGEFLKENIKVNASLSFVSAYFTIYAYASLKSELDSIDNLRFLFGEPSFINTMDPDKSEKKVFNISESGLNIGNVLLQKQIAIECKKWITDKVEIKSIKQSNLLHGKFYHIEANGKEKAIIGSSNFTRRGLGFAEKSNIELNLIVNDERDKTEIKNWFDRLWKDGKFVEDVKEKVLQYLEKLYIDNPPEFIYYKTLFHLFERFLQEQKSSFLLNEKVKITETEVWNTLYGFQKHGATASINKLLNYNGCIIADSVGLGKTYEALAVIKYFELMNNRVLVLCPKKLRKNWTVFKADNNTDLNPFKEDRFSFTVLNHTDLSRERGQQGDIDLSTINWGNYDLVVIDESHNFRNNTKGKKDEDGNIIKKSRYERLMDDIIKSGVKTKVLLLSATPVNNNLKDLRNQLYFFTESNDEGFIDSLQINSLNSLLKEAQTKFTNWAKKKRDQKVSSKELMDDLPPMFFKLLDELTIARSRKHIKKYYKEELEKIGAFPERDNLEPIYPLIDTEDMFLSYDKLNDEIEKYKLSLFNPSKYVLDEYKPYYEEKSGSKIATFSQADRESFLIGMMKVNFLKRLESSVESFEMTIGRTLEKIKNLINKIDEYALTLPKESNIDTDDTQSEESEDEDLNQAFEIGAKLKFNLAHMDFKKWKIDLIKDKDQLLPLFNAAHSVTVDRDAKLARLKQIIEDKITRPTKNLDGFENKKVLVFTAFSDTAKYIYDSIKTWVTNDLNANIAIVTGGSEDNKSTFMPKGFKSQSNFEEILTNFAPNARHRDKMKSMPQEGGIDILIATDCISEGQNLQDCDFMVNYDIHWNPVRIIQRFGRIDRIGSRNKKIHMQNFWPTPDLNKYINLKTRVEARMALVDITATGEDDLLNQDQIQELIESDLKYRDKQLLRLQKEVLDLEDLDDSISFSDFNLDDFRMDLLKYIKENRKTLEEAPLGLYSIVPTLDNPLCKIERNLFDEKVQKIMVPGIIFCLKQKINSEESRNINILHPYFLVYIRDDGQVRYNFTNAKNILEMYRILCINQSEAIPELFKQFDEETADGLNMSKINSLLESACSEIIRAFKKKSIQQLQSDRGALLIPESKQAKDYSGFELVTWLIIR